MLIYFVTAWVVNSTCGCQVPPFIPLEIHAVLIGWWPPAPPHHCHHASSIDAKDSNRGENGGSTQVGSPPPPLLIRLCYCLIFSPCPIHPLFVDSLRNVRPGIWLSFPACVEFYFHACRLQTSETLDFRMIKKLVFYVSLPRLAEQFFKVTHQV